MSQQGSSNREETETAGDVSLILILMSVSSLSVVGDIDGVSASFIVGALQQVQHGREAVPLLLEYYVQVSM